MNDTVSPASRTCLATVSPSVVSPQPLRESAWNRCLRPDMRLALVEVLIDELTRRRQLADARHVLAHSVFRAVAGRRVENQLPAGADEARLVEDLDDLDHRTIR